MRLPPGTYYYYQAAKPDLAARKIKLYPYSATAVAAASTAISEATIVFSGNSNELQAKVGSTTYYGPSLKRINLSMLAKYAPQVGGQPADPLARDLRTQLVALTASAAPGTTVPPQQSFLLTGTYPNLNVAGFADRLPSGAPATLRNAMSSIPVTNLRFVLFQQPGESDLRVQLVSFDVLWNGSSYSIK